MNTNNSTIKIMYLNPVGFDAYDAFFAEMILFVYSVQVCSAAQFTNQTITFVYTAAILMFAQEIQ